MQSTSTARRILALGAAVAAGLRGMATAAQEASDAARRFNVVESTGSRAERRRTEIDQWGVKRGVSGAKLARKAAKGSVGLYAGRR